MQQDGKAAKLQTWPHVREHQHQKQLWEQVNSRRSWILCPTGEDPKDEGMVGVCTLDLSMVLGIACLLNSSGLDIAMHYPGRR